MHQRPGKIRLFSGASNSQSRTRKSKNFKPHYHGDRLCFRNPGLLKLPVETIYRGGNSKARNPKIQNMLRMIGFGENVGSGFPKIIAAWKETNWGEPQLLNKLDVDEVELVLPVPSPKANSDIAPANSPANSPAKASVKLNKTQIAIVKAIIMIIMLHMMT
ncbi:MAG: hypothetical protein K6B13_08970 [Prevotella sp.]|nr:hypothetical protein [Prevotella sp.]